MRKLTLITAAALCAAQSFAATVDVKGEVVKPGSIELTAGMRLRQAIDAVGGLSEKADPMAVTVVGLDGGETKVDLTKVGPTPLLEQGDTVRVPEFKADNYVMVAGAVAKPGAIPYREGITVGDVLQTANPFDEVSVSKVRIVGKEGIRELPKGITEAELYAMTLGPGEAVKVNYPGQAFSNRELLIIIAIIVLILVLK
jgi:protein involved in polysaccharide export with SLBB domain